jgi:hypothetical protein
MAGRLQAAPCHIPGICLFMTPVPILAILENDPGSSLEQMGKMHCAELEFESGAMQWAGADCCGGSPAPFTAVS